MRAAIILAAGRSRRFGLANKLLVRHRGKPLLRWPIETALHSPVGRIVVVTDQDHSRLTLAARGLKPRLTIVSPAPGYRGRRGSLLRGLQALRAGETECLVLLGDLPAMPFGIAARLATRAKRKYLATRAGYRGAPGHPVLIHDAPAVRERLEAGEPPFRRGEVRVIENGRGAVADIDRPRDFRPIPLKGTM